ncbi:MULTISPECIES: patatin-like phospholipase family protein [unclassified Streptomyces]|uniref:patatin-like phospholipase family protein n=1 Tax=unclassified Streptomyces TaxID=2593676 RepID=UPI000DB9DE17|nr:MULTISPECIES: patatin-like phospholipase family protein [unclassified Streptomyces]MYT69122.1 patatin-like phospholipase family protein [Streptomyces sp. SID8367]RAJ82634.1 NTE family protein [Streptomyces sp. PsTaAH-137]
MGDEGRALVLGGGGPVGGAWLVGVLAGLASAGVDPTDVDLTAGASAGAVFGARLLSGRSPQELYERQLAGADRIDLDVTTGQTLRFLWAALGSRDPERSVRRLGRAALRARAVPESAVLDTVRILLSGVQDWPERPLRVAVVDAASGEPDAFGRESGVTLLEAVAASCAVPVVWPPITVAGRRWMDGGCRSTAPLELARGHRRVLAVVPLPSAVGPHPHAERQAAALTAAGSHVTLVTPDAAARRAMGRDMTADHRRAGAARAGHAQGRTLAASGSIDDLLTA